MNSVKYKISFSIITCMLLFSHIGQGQIMVTSGAEVTAEDLVENILGEGIQYFNVQYQGADTAKGIFSNGYSTNLGLDGGIVLTSGSASNLPGPNNGAQVSLNNNMPGDATLTGMLGQTTYDASVLQFDLIPETEILSFKYVFGSDEYPANIWDDGFGIFVSGPNPLGGTYANKNIAIVPDSEPELHVSIFTINNETNEEYYIDNTAGAFLQYNGFTVVLFAWIEVVPCEQYHVKIAIADAEDGFVDSGVCLEENSVGFPEIDIQTEPYPEGISDNMIEGCVEMDIVFKLPNVSYSPAVIELEFVNGPGYASTPEDFTDENGEALQPFVTFEEGEDSIAIHIVPVKDNILEGDELIEFVVTNELGCFVRYDTVSFLIQDYYDMTDTISPPTVVCQCMDSIDIWVHVFDGIPPYSYLWEPGGYNTDSILVDPDTTTIYTVTYTDQCQETGTASTTVTVFPFADLESFYFEAVLNPGLPFDVYGEILEDTVLILLPPGTNPIGLIASLTTSMEWMWILVDGVYQEPGVTPNDFTNPLVYDIWSPGGHHSLWTVIAEVEVGQNETTQNDIQIFPNPAKEQLNILNASGYKVSLVSNLGIEVYSIGIEKEKQFINISYIEPGIYYLKFENEEGEFVRKIVIEK